MSFKGIGSQKSPYIIENSEQLEAANGIFKNEIVHWINNIAE